MPKGTHDLNAHTLNGPGYEGPVICDEQACRAVIASFDEIQAAGQRVWLDANHDDGGATAWVKGFSWDPRQGIMAKIEWTEDGESAIRGKRYFSFSPAFYAEKKTGRVVGLIKGHAAGGLVNAPAFGSAMPALIAARLGDTPGADEIIPETANMDQCIAIAAACFKILNDHDGYLDNPELSKSARTTVARLSRNPNFEFARHENNVN
jgi:hypothetical protein